MKNQIFAILAIFSLMVVSAFASDVTIDFEDGSLDDWVVVDDADLGDAGPSVWEIRDGEALDGKALYQGSNIWGTSGDNSLTGTIILYVAQEFTNFKLEIDVLANDNDGMGLVWGFVEPDNHYRAIMINDKWPSPAVDEIDGPFIKMQKRISNETPWHELIDVVKDDYVPYPEGAELHWVLEVVDGHATFTREDGLGVEGDTEIVTGPVGIQLYAQQAYFDNIVITDLSAGAAVDAKNKLASTWADLKLSR